MKKIRLLLLLIAVSSTTAVGNEMDLSGAGWKAWLDPSASWENDTLYLPDELQDNGALSKLPVNQPTGGWQVLGEVGKNVSVPMTMDEYFLDGINTNTYTGVSWVWRTFEVPEDWEGKVLLLQVEKARMRAEVYINQKLAAYDVVGETPFQFDVSPYLNCGAVNRIAIRLTNPGGRRGWMDDPLNWGRRYNFSSAGINFSTLGHVKIAARDQVFIEDVFVKNLLPAGSRKVEVVLTVSNKSSRNVRAVLPVTVTDLNGSQELASRELVKALPPGQSTARLKLTLSGADLWTPETPVLYNCRAEVKADGIRNIFNQRFGVRVIQWLPGESGEHNFYLNGKRFFLKTAIDWGFYAPAGDYATPETARRSVEAAKKMGQNAISFHRKIGEPLVMNMADEKGVFIWEEPGGFHLRGWQRSPEFSKKQVLEKIRRMVIRDRNHPSLFMYCLSNESPDWNDAREEALRLVNTLDNSRGVVNTSGIPPEPTPHFRPYEDELRKDYRDQHSAGNRGGRYNDADFYQKRHRREDFEDSIYYLGEVNSVTGPSDWYRVYQSALPKIDERPGYDSNIYKENHDRLLHVFHSWRLSEVGSGNIKDPGDISVQAGRGMMYIHGRHAQSIMCNNTADGYALNGWSTGPQSEGDYLDWDSGILDEGRFLKGPPESFSWWIRPLQISLSRINGKYFEPGDTAELQMNLINQGLLPPGDYKLKLSATDGQNEQTGFRRTLPVTVTGGDTFAQPLGDLSLRMEPEWSAGYITIHAKLFRGERVVADGAEQVLLRNRSSQQEDLAGLEFDIIHWPAAKAAVDESGYNAETNDPVSENQIHRKFILAGDLTQRRTERMKQWHWDLDSLLERVRDGEIMIVKFDRYWAEALHFMGVLSKPVTEWGGNQVDDWNGNGWGYLDHFGFDQSLGNNGTIGTTSWEVPADPHGFYPFESDHPLSAYGIYVARPWLCKKPATGGRSLEVQPEVAVLIGVIDYGKGKIILNPCYQIDEDNAFCDMLFYNTIKKASQGRW